MAGNDLIGPRQAPSGNTKGVEMRGGDSYHRLNISAGNIPFGPVVPAVDPLSALTRHFRFGVVIQDNGDGTTTPVPQITEIDAEGNVIP